MDFKCTCHNSGTNSFTGHCARCGMEKPLNGTIININTIGIEKPDTWFDVFNNVEALVNSLQRYTPEPKNDWVEMVKYKEGEYVKIEDVLTLFGAKKQLK